MESVIIITYQWINFTQIQTLARKEYNAIDMKQLVQRPRFRIKKDYFLFYLRDLAIYSTFYFMFSFFSFYRYYINAPL